MTKYNQEAEAGEKLFRNLFKDTNGGIYIRLIKDGYTRSAAFTHIDLLEFTPISHFIETNKELGNLYFGVSTRKASDHPGKKESCSELNAYFADLDFKDFPQEGEGGARNKIKDSLLPPSCVVNTGNGFHLYWFFKNPIMLSAENIPLHEQRMKGIAEQLNGDKVYDVSRILRIPGTTNFPTANKIKSGITENKLCTIEFIDENLRYSPESFDQFIKTDLKTADKPLQPASSLTLPPRFEEDLKSNWNLAKLWQGDSTIKKRGSDQIDRSKMDWALTQELLRLGYSDLDIISVLMSFSFGKAQQLENSENYIRITIQNSRKGPSPDKGPKIGSDFKFYRIAEVLQKTPEKMDWLVDDLLPATGTSIIAAKPKVGKSTLARNLAICISRGESFIGRSCKKGDVLYLALDEFETHVSNEIRRMGINEKDSISITYQLPENGDNLKALERAIISQKPSLIIVDTLAHLTKIKDINDYSGATSGLKPFIDLARAYKTHVCFLHHAKKGETEGIDASLGSTAITGIVDTVIVLKKSNKDRYISSDNRSGTYIENSLLVLDSDGYQVSLGNNNRYNASEVKIKTRIIELLTEKRVPFTEDQIIDNTTGKKVTINSVIRALIGEGLLIRTGEGKANSPYFYALNQSSSDLFKNSNLDSQIASGGAQ